MKNSTKILFLIIYLNTFTSNIFSQKPKDSLDLWAFEIIDIVKNKKQVINKKPIVVAVVDDAFSITHKSLKPFLYSNPKEITSNGLDDDGNGYIDDIHGWDIGDNDQDVNPVNGREQVFYHGTFVASIITRIASMHYGEKASDLIKIMPVKVLEDQVTQTYLKKGYLGIKYALDNGADIINLSWSGGEPSKQERQIIEEAHAKGILIIASSGNFNNREILYPSNFKEVMAVSGIDANHSKFKSANYGDGVNISAPAKHVAGAFPTKENAFIHDEGTSCSAAIVSGVAAILKSKNPEFTNEDIKEILENSALPFSNIMATHQGLLGSGIVNLNRALRYMKDPTIYDNTLLPNGTLQWNTVNKDKALTVKPHGIFEGFYLQPDIRKIKKTKNKSFSIFLKDSLWNTFSFSNFPKRFFIPNDNFSVKIDGKLQKNDLFKIHYQSKSIDSTRLFCKEIEYISAPKGTINDGSGANNYVNNVSCKWQFNAPKGKKIKFTFHKMNTEANIDYIYLANGKSLIQENIFAVFSGNNIPPVVTSMSNEVLLWFMTDKKNTSEGWEFSYEFIE